MWSRLLDWLESPVRQMKIDIVIESECFIPEDAIKMLQGKLWHTTSECRFKGIRKAGAIQVNPNIDNNERWKTSQGLHFWPYVRKLGGVSLFDFRDFDPDAYDQKCPSSSWRSFVPICRRWKSAVWLEIDREKVRDELIPGDKLLNRWKEDKAGKHTLMPHIEVAHIGDLPISAVSNVLLCQRGTAGFQQLNLMHNATGR